MANVINYFRNENNFLSNFAYAFIEIDGVRYPTVENAFQAMKCKDKEDRLMFVYQKPGAAKRLGRKVQLREDWEDIKVKVMYILLVKKFSQPEFREKLLATGDARLIEGNTWGDKFWGVPFGKTGKNILGKLLMKVRQELRDGKY